MARQSRAPVILLTRPLAQSARFAEGLAALGGQRVVISPLLAPVFLHPVLPVAPFRALILTSETGVEAARRISAAGQTLPQLAFCVGDRTAEAATAAGFTAQSAKGNAGDLVRMIQTQSVAGPLLHLRGADSRGDVAKTLTIGGIETVEAVVYAQSPQPLTAEALALFGGADPVLTPIFSPRSAALLAAAAPKPRKAPLWVAAMSAAVADAATGLAAERTAIAATPDAGGMHHAIAALLAADGSA